MSAGLLDVNMLIALAWPSHVHHGAAHGWFATNAATGWATCPLTECAFVRISSNPHILADAVEPMDALGLLRQMVAQEGHVFWPDTLALHDTAMPTEMLAGHRQVTDAYLLGLARHHGGRLITLDRGIEAVLPPGQVGQDAVEVVGT